MVASAPKAALSGRGLRFARRSAASNKISRRIGWLNKNAGLERDIRYSEVKDLLAKLGETEAMRLLDGVEAKGVELQNPTSYVLAAARRLVSGGDRAAAQDGDGEELGGEAGRPPRKRRERERNVSQQIAMRMRWLNANAGLSQELDVDQIGPTLTAVGRQEAMDVLKQLEESAPEIRDPNAWVNAAVQRALNASVDGSVGEAPGGRRRRRRPDAGAGSSVVGGAAPRGVIKTALKLRQTRPQSSARFLRQLEQRVAWLNSNAGLAEELRLEKIQNVMEGIGQAEAMRVLKVLEQNAAGVQNPTAYVLRIARRHGTEAARAGPSQAPPPMGKAVDPERLARRVDWLNTNAGLSSVLDLDRVAPHLEALDHGAAMDILKRLEEGAAEVRDPNGFVIAAARRAPAVPGDGGGAAPWMRLPEVAVRAGSAGGRSRAAPLALPAVASPAAGRMGGMDPEVAKLQRRIEWLNSVLELSSPLDFDRVAPALLDAGYTRALEVLNSLEERSPEISDPNGFVIAGARRSAGGNSVSSAGATPVSTPVGTPRRAARGRARGRGSADDEERLAVRVGWLSRNACPDAPLDYDRISPFLRAGSAIVGGGGVVGGGAGLRGDEDDLMGQDERPSRRRRRGRGGKVDFDGPEDGDVAPLEAQVSPIDSKVTFYGKPGGSSAGSAPDETLRRRVAWLNENAQLAGRLEFDEVAPSLMRLEPSQAMDLLQRLENNAPEVRDPNGFVIAGAARAAGGARHGRRRGGGRL